MTRYAAIVCLLLVTAGCSVGNSSPTADPSSATPVDTTEATELPLSELPSGEACREARPPDSTTSKAGLKPSDYPDVPAQLDTRSVSTFVREYERAYLGHEYLASLSAEYDSLSVDVFESETVAGEEGRYFVVTVKSDVSFADTVRSQTYNGTTQTPTSRPHGDFPEEATYFVSDQYVIRYDRITDSNDIVWSAAELVVCRE